MIHCKECSPMMINGVFCHEIGCSNSRKVWDDANEEWVAQAKDDEEEWLDEYFGDENDEDFDNTGDENDED